MKDEARWKPTRFEVHGGGFRASRDLRHVARGSRLIGDITAPVYLDLVRRHARGRLVDLGCGEAPLYGMYRDHVDSVTCVDWSRSVHASDHLDLEADLNEPLPLADASFDTVILSSVLEHVLRPRELLAEIARVLAPGGKLLCVVPFMYRIHEQPHDYFRYSRFALSRFCADAGLEELELEPFGGALEVLLDVSGKLLSRSRAASAVHLAVSGALRRIPALRRASLRSSEHFPLGYALVARRTDVR